MRKLVVLFLVIAVGGIAVALPAHFWITDRLAVLRTFYLLQAPLAKWNMRCSANAPLWLPRLAEHTIDRQFSLANQLAYMAPDGTLHHCETGWQGDMLRSPELGVGTRFRYASLSKLLTADAVLARIDTGRLSLDTRLLDVLPELRPVAGMGIENITIAHLLRHRAGMDRLRRPDPMTMHGARPWCPGELSHISRLRLDFAPGERQAYSNLGYCLLGVVLERLEGRPFRDIMETDYGLAARGMAYIDGPYLADEVRYDFRNSSFYGEDYYRHFDFPALSSSAGLSGNASALARLLHEVLHRRPLNIVSAPADAACDPKGRDKCFGYAASLYRPSGTDLTLHVQGGLLFGAASKAVIDSRGGITVWLGSGMSQKPGEQSEEFITELSAMLSQHYDKQS